MKIEIHTGGGRLMDICNPQPEDIKLDDIAHALSNICRYGGHYPVFYSVAEHCVHAATLARNQGVGIRAQRALLLHDAHEAYIGDMVKPIKYQLDNLGDIAAKLDKTISQKFNVPLKEFHASIKYYDDLVLQTELRAAGWGGNDVQGVKINGWSPAIACFHFEELAKELGIQ